MKALLLVALGGACGALLRWAVAGGVEFLATRSRTPLADQWDGARFPWGILAVNLLGCLAIGILYGLAESRDWLTDATRWLVLVGFLGSFTTFSTFGWQSFELLKQGQVFFALGNVLASVLGGLLLVWAGYALVR